MTFEEYFRLEGVSEEEQYLRFFVGLAPARLQSGYLIDPGAIDVFARKGPSTAMGCELCAGAAATQVLKMLLKRGKVVAAPWGLQFDAYANRLAKTWRPGGNNNPLQKLAISIGKKQLLQKSKSKKKATYRPVTAAERVLDLARWAPSGDKTALQSLDEEQREAAGMDGARAPSLFFYIVLPHLARAITVVILIETIFLLAVFAEILVTTSGGPGHASTNITYLVYHQALLDYDVGGASAGGVVAVILANIVAIFLVRIVGKNLDA
jgi:hypothetical protein